MSETVIIEPAAIVENFVGEITGLDLSAGPDAATADLLRRAHRDYPVLAIRGQQLDPEALMAFGQVFGEFELDLHLPQFQDKQHPEVVYLDNRDADGKPSRDSADRGASWHADSTFKANPCKHSVLYAIAIPSHGAGTHFADMRGAYETLPDDIKRAIDGRDAKHKFSAGRPEARVIAMTEEQEKLHPAVIHPMVRTDPETGLKTLNVNPLHVYGIVDMAQAEAEPLLDAIFAHALNPDFQYLHNYRVGDLVIWDQRRTWHKAEAAYPMDEHRRLMRVKIAA